MAAREKKPQPEPQSMGHEWDGIEELNNPLPRWWLICFYITIFWGVAYTIAYPAWPLIDRATTGVLGWTSHGQLKNEMNKASEVRAPVMAALAATPLEQLPANPRLMQAAVEGGQSAYKVYCVQCHGSGAAGAKGYPNLNDDDWLWGGDINAIHTTLLHGIRSTDDEQTRVSQMPAFGRDGILNADQIRDVVSYVRTISHQQKGNASARRGAELFAANCAVCHGPAGKGDRNLGAPNLTDAIWLFGGDAESLTATISNSRAGVMPAWQARLDPVTIKQLAAYVHSLGGGE